MNIEWKECEGEGISVADIGEYNLKVYPYLDYYYAIIYLPYGDEWEEKKKTRDGAKRWAEKKIEKIITKKLFKAQKRVAELETILQQNKEQK